jgi:hypothetical protein
MELFDGVIYINLDRRTDRRLEIEGVLTMLGLSGERFAAIPHEYSIYGCGQSHLAVLKMARARGWRNVLILEDDFEPLVAAEEFWKTVRECMAEVPDWQVFMLAYNPLKIREHSKQVNELLYAATTSAYCVRCELYEELIRLWEWSLPRLLSDRSIYFMSDEVWATLQQEGGWYGPVKQIGRQRASWSDIQNKFVDYGV